MTDAVKKKIVKWFWILFSFPIILVGGLIAIVWACADIPSFEELENPDSKLATQVISSDGEVITTFHIENRSYVSYEDLSPNLVHAAVATEDERFYRHSGIDFESLARVLVKTLLAGDSSNVNSIAARQFKQVLNAFYAETGPALLTGDFNLKLPIMEQLVDKSKLISMNGGLDWLTINSKASIDNIYVRNVEPYFPESKPGLYVGEKMGKQLENAWPSDHNPIWAYFKIKKY